MKCIGHHIVRRLLYFSRRSRLTFTSFLAWSISFYPQVIENHLRRSTSGASIDYPILNVYGFIPYSIYTISLLCSPVIQAQYGSRHIRSPKPAVSWADFAFASQSTVITSISVTQYWWYPKDRAENVPGRRPSRWVLLLSLVSALFIVAITFAAGGGLTLPGTSWKIEWLDVIYAFSWLKFLSTFIKYFPQMLLNYRRKSTYGWSIHQIQLDIVGGVASSMQLVIDSLRSGGNITDGVLGNLVKLFLGVYSLIADAVFVYQHYVAYPDSHSSSTDVPDPERLGEEDNQPLLDDARP